MNKVTPLVFCDGSLVFNKYLKEYVVHGKGLFILAPSGSGKTYFVNHQQTKNWIDGDDLWTEAGAQPRRPWWTEGLDIIEEIDQKSDVITVQAKKLGLWIIGASNNWLVPDAVAIPDWEIHKKYIAHREKHDYDGGATSNDLTQVQSHIKWMQERAEKLGIPIFKSILEATLFLENKRG